MKDVQCMNYMQNTQYIQHINNARYAYICNICAYGNTTYMHKVLGAFLKHSQISITLSVLILQLAAFRTCNLAQLVCHV